MDIKKYMLDVGQCARKASRTMAVASSAEKNNALLAIAEIIEQSKAELLTANQEDMAAGTDLDTAMLDRLELDDNRIAGMVDGLRQVAALADPVGEITDLNYRPSGIQVGKMRVPLGVVGIIYESRPNVTADAAALALKSGNATILRGGSEAIRSNQAVAKCVKEGLQAVGLAGDAVQVIETTDRAAVGELLAMNELVDVIIPRGGRGLIERISREATMPVIKHLDGVCHVYIHQHADLEKAVQIAFNSKSHRYGVCNAMETLLIDRAVAEQVLNQLFPMYRKEGVEIRGCPATREIIPGIIAATEQDWMAEYLAPILAIRIVDSVDQAIEHINQYGSQHTDAIVSEDYSVGRRFIREVDSSSVMINASTRFADGYEYGLGAEIGISTDKFHARGPVGLEGLTSQKYVVFGDGQIRR